MSPSNVLFHVCTFLLFPLLLGCGKKGPPLPPLVRVPAPVERLEARRAGRDVFVTLAVPAQNVDASTPADVNRIEVYAFTGVAPPAADEFPEVGSRVASVPVALPGTPAEQVGAAAAMQGSTIVVRDRLSPEALQVRMPPPPRTRDAAPAAGAPRRFYVAIAYNSRGRASPPDGVAELPLTALPEPPPGLRGRHGPGSVVLTWEPSTGLVGGAPPAPATDRVADAAPDDPDATGAKPVPAEPAAPGAGPARYNVYVSMDSAAPVSEPGPFGPAAPAPLNAEPLAAQQFTDTVTLDGRERCYVVRAVRTLGAGTVESEPSAPACVELVDTFPPSPPTGLSAVAAAGAISLIWEPGPEDDVAGYLVLRGEPGDATLARLTETPNQPDPVHRSCRGAGRTRYVYAVVAVDDRVPTPNVSAESHRVEETAR